MSLVDLEEDLDIVVVGHLFSIIVRYLLGSGQFVGHTVDHDFVQPAGCKIYCDFALAAAEQLSLGVLLSAVAPVPLETKTSNCHTTEI